MLTCLNKVQTVRHTTCNDLKKFIVYIDANSDKHPLIARLDKEIYDESNGDLDQKSSAFHIDDKADEDNQISDRESIQV